MSRPAMIAAVCLAAYCLIDLAISAVVAMIWRTRAVAPANLPPTVRARQILLLRITPFLAATAITVLIVGPAFALFEPNNEYEAFGPVLAVLALIGFAHLAAAIARGAYSIWLTNRVEREWLQSSTEMDSLAGMRAFAVDAGSPIVALVGIVSPKLIAARSVIDACTAEELASIVGHERGHFMAHDNFKRWLMMSLPDTLRVTPIHRDMISAWHHAAEDAADDAATQGEPEARADLAALLLKVVRLAPHPIWRSAVVSPFVERDGLERRVRRLLQPELEPPAPLAIVPAIGLGIMIAAGIAVVSSPATLRAIFVTFENLVAFGR